MISLVTSKLENVYIHACPNTKETTKIKEVYICNYRGCRLIELEMTKVIFQKKDNDGKE